MSTVATGTATTVEQGVRATGAQRPWIETTALVLVVAVCVVALLAVWVTPYPPNQQALRERLQAPSLAHWLGTDQYGRDILSRVIAGAQISLLVSTIAVGIAVVTGSALGVVAGYFGGRIDAIAMRIADTMLSLPSLVFALGMMAMLGAGVLNIVAAIAVTMAPTFARVVRAVALSIRSLDYVAAARALGLRDGRILLWHVVPNCLSPIIVLASVTVARAILIEANLSFLGVGVPSTTVTWGLMANEGQQFLLDAPWVSLVPALAIMVTVLAINILGDGLRDRLDPRTARR
jgi:ABC-type dipeptide/oligopeptide/nickel transport system permease subunit